jgi:hypothetical protein
MTESASIRTGVEITTKVFPMAFLLLFYKTNVTIDGVTSAVPWGTHFYELEPGRHNIRIGFRYMLGKNMGESQIDVDVSSGQVTKILYRSPLVVFSPGTISAT